MRLKRYLSGVGLGAFIIGFTMKVATRPEVSGALDDRPVAGTRSELPATFAGSDAAQPRRLRGPAAVETDEIVTSADAMSALGYSNRQIFEKQDRDDHWATQVETFFRPELEKLRAELMPYAQDVGLECKHSVCKLTMQVPAASLEEAYFLVQKVQFGSGLQAYSADAPDESGRVEVGGYLELSDASRPVGRVADQYRRLIAERFADGFSDARRWLDEHGMAGIRGEEPR